MNETIQLLQDVVRNARSGEEAINQLMDKVESQEMRGELDREREQYRASAQEAESALAAAGGRAEPVGALQKAGMWVGTQMNTLTDRSHGHHRDDQGPQHLPRRRCRRRQPRQPLHRGTE